MKTRKVTFQWFLLLAGALFFILSAPAAEACGGHSGDSHKTKTEDNHKGQHVSADERTQEKKKLSHESAKVIVWTCVMHPEVKASFKAKCPKCGMSLERSNVQEHF